MSWCWCNESLSGLSHDSLYKCLSKCGLYLQRECSVECNFFSLRTSFSSHFCWCCFSLLWWWIHVINSKWSVCCSESVSRVSGNWFSRINENTLLLNEHFMLINSKSKPRDSWLNFHDCVMLCCLWFSCKENGKSTQTPRLSSFHFLAIIVFRCKLLMLQKSNAVSWGKSKISH